LAGSFFSKQIPFSGPPIEPGPSFACPHACKLLCLGFCRKYLQLQIDSGLALRQAIDFNQ